MGKPELKMVALDQIRVNPVALREANRNAQDFKELLDSVKERGVMEPIQLRRKKDEKDKKEFELINGLQRYTASEICDFKEIPAAIFESSDADVLEQQIITNAIRVQTKPAEFAKGIQRMLATKATMTETQLAAKLHKTPAWISKQLSLNKLDDPIKKLVDDGKIPVANAYSLAKLPTEEQPAWVTRSQTMDALTFGAQCLARAKEMRAADRKGQTPGEQTFVPVARYRKRADVMKEMEQPEIGPALIKANDLLSKHKKAEDLAKAVWQLAVQWSMNLDPQSVNEQKSKDDARKLKEQKERADRTKERTDQKAREAAEEQARIAKLTQAQGKAQPVGAA